MTEKNELQLWDTVKLEVESSIKTACTVQNMMTKLKTNIKWLCACLN